MAGPIDYIVLAFPGNQFKGEILPEIDKVVANGSIRIVDLLFVMKDNDGNVTAIELQDMPEDIAEKLKPVSANFEGLLSESDIPEVGELLANNSSGAVFIFEHLWATDLKQAIINSGGVLLADGRIRTEDVEAAEADLAATTK